MARALVKNASNPNPPNLIINGGMDFWQRGIGPTSHGTSPSYATADRWMFELSGSGSYNSERSTIVPDSRFQYSAQMTHSGATNGGRNWYKIEAANIAPYIGKSVCFSVWIRVQTGTYSAFNVGAYSPVGGKDTWAADPSATDVSTVPEVSIMSQLGATGAWARISVAFTVPAAAVDGLAILFRANASSIPLVYQFTGAMLTEGVAPPANFYRAGDDVEAELAMCQRYFNSPNSFYLGSTDTSAPYGHGFAQTTTSARVIIPFPVTMRIQPVLVSDSSNSIVYANLNTPVVSMSIADRGLSAVTMAVTTAAVLTVGQGLHLRKNGNTGYIWLSSEL